jgi:CTP:molybdopterin cytidylyltransferase MocA
MNLALVLAAGRGTRVGGAKALMVVDGEPLALAHARARAEDCDRVVIVARRDVVERLGARDEHKSHEGSVFCISEEDDALGPAGSIRAAVTSGALSGAEKILVTPVDVTPASTAVVRALFDALSREHEATRFAHGHPIAIRAATLAEHYARGAGEARPLRDVLAALGDRAHTLPMPPTPLPRTLDRVEDVVSLTGAPPRFLSMERPT